MTRNKIFILISIVFFSLFILFSYLTHKNLFTQFDFNTTVRLQDNISRRLDIPFSAFSDIGSFEVVTFILVIFLLFKRKFLGLGAFFLYGMFHIIEIFGKTFVDHFPPPEFMLRTIRSVYYPQFHVRAEFSYPSGHAGRAAFFTSLIAVLILQSNLSLTKKSILLSFLLTYDLIMFVSRVYLGEHWTTDVIGGALLGASFGIFSGLMLSLNKSK